MGGPTLALPWRGHCSTHTPTPTPGQTNKAAGSPRQPQGRWCSEPRQTGPAGLSPGICSAKRPPPPKGTQAASTRGPQGQGRSRRNHRVPTSEPQEGHRQCHGHCRKQDLATTEGGAVRESRAPEATPRQEPQADPCEERQQARGVPGTQGHHCPSAGGGWTPRRTRARRPRW